MFSSFSFNFDFVSVFDGTEFNQCIDRLIGDKKRNEDKNMNYVAEMILFLLLPAAVAVINSFPQKVQINWNDECRNQCVR